MDKKRNKMNMGLVFFVVALFVVSTGMSAMGNVVSSDVEKENNGKNVITMNTDVTLDCGLIKVSGYPGSYPDVEYYCSATDYPDVNVGDSGYVTVEVGYELWAGGADDKATARIWFTDDPSNKATFTTPNNNNRQDDKLSLTRHMEDASSYSLKLEVEWRDYISSTNLLVGGTKPSDTNTISTKEYVPPPDDPILEVIGDGVDYCNTWQSEPYKAYIHVKNVVRDTKLDWELTSVSRTGRSSPLEDLQITYKDRSYFAKNYNLVIQKLHDENLAGGDQDILYGYFYIPPNAGYKVTFSWVLTFYCEDTDQYETASVWFKTRGRGKAKTYYATSPYDFLQTQFPQLFTLLQRLPAFQQ